MCDKKNVYYPSHSHCAVWVLLNDMFFICVLNHKLGFFYITKVDKVSV